MTTRYVFFWRTLVCLALLSQVASPQAVPNQDAVTPIEYVRQLQLQQGEGLGTAVYAPSKLEQTFPDRLAEDQKQTGGLAGSYDITQQQGKFVGWFGIVREVVENATTRRTKLTIEHKYFDGLTDTHILALSFNGSGDFDAELKGIDLDIEPLTLVKVYGRVGALMPDARPTIQAEFVRNWLWGAYTFLMAAGEQRGSDVWRKLNTVPLDDIYNPHPDDSYYVARLGPLPATVQVRRDTILMRAAGPVSPELNVALLALVKGLRQGFAFTRTPELSRCCSEIRRHRGEQAAAKTLVALLKSPQRDVRGDEVMAFREFAEASAVELSKMLDEVQPAFRLVAAQMLGNLAPAARSTVPQLIKRLHDQPDIQRAAVEAIENLGDASQSVRTALLPLLESPDEFTRIATAKCLVSLRVDDGAGMQSLVAAVKHDEVTLRYSAVLALRELEALATPAVVTLAEALRDSDENVRMGAAEALSEIGADAKAAVIPLAAALVDSNSNVGAYAADALGDIGPAAEAAIPQLIEVASSAEATLRARVAQALGKIRLRPEQCVPLLVKMLDDEDDHVQFMAEGALREFRGQAEPALLKLLRTGATENVRWHAAMVLGEISHSDETVRALIEKLGDSSAHVRRFSAYSLGKIGINATSALSALAKTRSDPSAGVRIAAAGAVIRAGGPVQPSLDVLMAELKPSHSSIEARWAAEEIATIGAPAKSAIPLLVNSLSATDDYRRKSAAVALGAIGPEAHEAVGALESCLKDRREYVAANAAAAMWRIARHPAALPALEAALKSDDSMARVSAVMSCAEFGPAASAIVPSLRSAVRDRNADVRREARAALPKITGQPLSEAELPGATPP